MRLSAERRCDRPDVADVSVHGQIADVVGRIPVSITIHQNIQFILYALTERKQVQRTLDCHMITRTQVGHKACSRIQHPLRVRPHGEVDVVDVDGKSRMKQPC